MFERTGGVSGKAWGQFYGVLCYKKLNKIVKSHIFLPKISQGQAFFKKSDKGDDTGGEQYERLSPTPTRLRVVWD